MQSNQTDGLNSGTFTRHFHVNSNAILRQQAAWEEAELRRRRYKQDAKARALRSNADELKMTRQRSVPNLESHKRNAFLTCFHAVSKEDLVMGASKKSVTSVGGWKPPSNAQFKKTDKGFTGTGGESKFWSSFHRPSNVSLRSQIAKEQGGILEPWDGGPAQFKLREDQFEFVHPRALEHQRSVIETQHLQSAGGESHRSEEFSFLPDY